MSKFTENHVEEAALAWLRELGYETLHGLDIGSESVKPKHVSYGDVVLQNHQLQGEK
jgi:type I restriction enzyme R subunit